jgi:hypothetical protein
MLLTALGLITVTNAGTPIVLTASATLRAGKLLIVPRLANTGALLVKDKAGNIVRAISPPPATGLLDHFEISSHHNVDGLQLSQYQLDATVNGDGGYVSYWTE